MVNQCINRAHDQSVYRSLFNPKMNLLFTFMLNFAVDIPNDSYFIILGNRSSARLYRDGGYIELILLEDTCYEQFHIPVGDKTSFSYNWVNKSVDGIGLTRYEGNCNISSFDYDGDIYHETCREAIQQQEEYNIEYFVCFLIPILLLSRSDTLYNFIKRFHNHLHRSENTVNNSDDDPYETMV